MLENTHKPYTLMASSNLGASYVPVMSADDTSEFEDKIEKLNNDYVRWYIKGPEGDLADVCQTHKVIVNTLRNI